MFGVVCGFVCEVFLECVVSSVSRLYSSFLTHLAIFVCGFVLSKFLSHWFAVFSIGIFFVLEIQLIGGHSQHQELELVFH